MTLEELMTKASHMAINPKDYAVLRKHYAEKHTYQVGQWWNFSFNGIQVVPSDLVSLGEIHIAGVRNGQLVMLGKIVSMEIPVE